MINQQKQKLLQQYWDAQAQFGPFEVTPNAFLRLSLVEGPNSPIICKRCGATESDSFCYCNA